jgi:hypothetical protein
MGLRSVADLRGTSWLIIAETAITDGGLRHLESLSNLVYLDLRDCPGVTDAGVVRLQKALPNCQIVR